MDQVSFVLLGVNFVVLVILMSTMASCYKKCRPNQVMIVSGLLVNTTQPNPLSGIKLISDSLANARQPNAQSGFNVLSALQANATQPTEQTGFKIVRGGTVVLPLIQQYSYLSLEVMNIEVRSHAPIISSDGVPISAYATAQIKIKNDDLSVSLAAELFLDKSNKEIMSVAHEPLVAHMRAVLRQIDSQNPPQELGSLARRIEDEAQPDLQKIGLTIVSFTIKEISVANRVLS